MFTLGQAAKQVGKSKPTISKAIKDGRLSAQKVDGVYQIEPSELLRVFSATPRIPLDTPVATSDTPIALALAEQNNRHLESRVADLEARLAEMKEERDTSQQEAREDRQRVVALLEDRRPRSLWSLFKGK